MSEEQKLWKCNRCGNTFKDEEVVMKHIVKEHKLSCYPSLYTKLSKKKT